MAEDKKQSILKSKIKSYSKEAEEALIKLAIEFIKTEAGKKAIGTNLDIDSLTSENGKPLTPSQIQERSKEYIPQIQYFQVNGRLYDAISSDPIAKVQVSPLPLTAIGDQVQTNDLGQFTIVLGIPILPYNQKALTQPQLTYRAEGFVPEVQAVITEDRMVKTDLKTRALINIEKAASKEGWEYIKKVYAVEDKVKSLALSATDKVLVFRRNAIQKLVSTILFKLIPILIGLLLLFGITKISDLDKAICPTPDQLKDAIRRRNRLARQLNQIYVALAANVALAAVYTYISSELKKTIVILRTTPAVPGAPLLSIENIVEILQKFVDDNKQLNKQLGIGVLFLVAALILTLLILKALDQLIFECSPNAELDELNQELRDLEKETANNAVGTTTQINGFTLEIQTVDQTEIDGHKRKQAVGKNAQGVILIKGDPSFSAGDTVLINELAYYIQSNDLKAY